MVDARLKQVTVIGSGPAGLAAAVRLLERGQGRVGVTLLHMGHHFGGKAASYVDARDRQIDHGWHMVLGFYARMRRLMRAAGIDFDRTFSSMHSISHCYERWNGRLHKIDSGGGDLAVALRFATYEGLPFADRANFNRFMAFAFATARSGQDIEHLDDICFDAWARENGLRPHVMRTSLFRTLREGYFNFPEHISAYHALRTMQVMGSSRDSEAHVCVGPMSDLVWKPIADHVTRLGGRVVPYTMVTDWVYEGRRIAGLRVAKPDPEGHEYGMTSWKTDEIPREDGAGEVLAAGDAIVSTIPPAVLATMNKTDTRMWRSPFFARIRNLRSVSTVGMRIVTRRRVTSLVGPIFGLRAPLGIAIRMTDHLSAFRGIAGDVLDFVGQEPGFESWTDEQMRDLALEELGRALGVALRTEDLEYWELHRNRSNHERLFLCEPGVQKFRPGPRTPFENLFFAGDWVRNEIDLVCMEGAIASGEAAADHALGYVDHGGTP